MPTAKTALELIEIAEAYALNSSAAAACLASARICFIDRNYRSAANRALGSLEKSVGIFDAQYIRAAALVKEAA
jgi:hypothetical protein